MTFAHTITSRPARRGGVAIAVLLACWPAVGQTQVGAGTAAAPRAAVAVAVAAVGAPRLDGEILGDPAWANAVPETGFRQTQPDEGEPASERTEVRVIFTESTLYVGIVCYDRDARAITISDSRRDSSLDDGDSVQIILVRVSRPHATTRTGETAALEVWARRCGATP